MKKMSEAYDKIFRTKFEACHIVNAARYALEMIEIHDALALVYDEIKENDYKFVLTSVARPTALMSRMQETVSVAAYEVSEALNLFNEATQKSLRATEELQEELLGYKIDMDKMDILRFVRLYVSKEVYKEGMTDEEILEGIIDSMRHFCFWLRGYDESYKKITGDDIADMIIMRDFEEDFLNDTLEDDFEVEDEEEKSKDEDVKRYLENLLSELEDDSDVKIFNPRLRMPTEGQTIMNSRESGKEELQTEKSKAKAKSKGR